MFEESHISENIPTNASLVRLHWPVQRITSNYSSDSEAEIYHGQMFHQIPEYICCPRSRFPMPRYFRK